MKYSVNRVGPHTHLDVPLETLSHSDRLIILDCAGGSTTTVPAGFAGLWWCIRGQALALSADSRIALSRRWILISDSQRSHSVAVQAGSHAFGLVGSQALWSSLITLFEEGSGGEPAVFPALHMATATHCKKLLLFLRSAVPTEGDGLDASKGMHLAMVICELQRLFAPLIARCPGPSLSRRRTVFLRLQRVRNHLSHWTQPNMDVGDLALTTNYSIWRFIRVYCSVFGETPYSHISRLRVDRAKKLLEAGELCVGDIALAVGFENGSSLTRAIKKRYGLSATEIRRFRNRLESSEAPT